MTDKKKYTTVSQRVDKEICDQVKEHITGQETVGGFYDRAASEKLERERRAEKAQYDERLNRVK